MYQDRMLPWFHELFIDVFISDRWVATSALPPLDKLYSEVALFEERFYGITAAGCNALLPHITSASLITEDDLSGKYDPSERAPSSLYSGMFRCVRPSGGFSLKTRCTTRTRKGMHIRQASGTESLDVHYLCASCKASINCFKHGVGITHGYL
jgi:hypothetical protein